MVRVANFADKYHLMTKSIVLIQNLQKAKMTLKSLNPDSDLLNNILEVVSDLRQTAHMLEDVVHELMKNVDIKTQRPEEKT